MIFQQNIKLAESEPLLYYGTHSFTHANTKPCLLRNTCTVTPRCLQETPSLLILCFPLQAPAGIEATLPYRAAPACVCSCWTCPAHARTASISRLTGSAGGPSAGRAAEQERVKTSTFLSLEAVTNIGVY